MAKSFRDWFKENLSDYAEEIAEHGADSGFPYITYIGEACHIFNKYADEIWEMAAAEAEELGYKNVAEMIAGFKRSDMLHSYDTFRNLLLWYACETVAREFVNK